MRSCQARSIRSGVNAFSLQRAAVELAEYKCRQPGSSLAAIAAVLVDRGSGVAGGPDVVAELEVLVDHHPDIS